MDTSRMMDRKTPTVNFHIIWAFSPSGNMVKPTPTTGRFKTRQRGFSTP
jgi:hypothetical protein